MRKEGRELKEEVIENSKK